MAQPRRSVGELLAMGVIAGLVAYGLAYATRPRGAPRPPSRVPTVLWTHGASFELHPGPGRLSIRTRDGGSSRDVDLSIVVDGVAQGMHFSRDAVRPGPNALRATVPVVIDDATAEVELEIVADEARDAVTIDIGSAPGGPSESHAVALRADLSSDGQVVFVPGVGPLADRATLSAASVVVEGDTRPFAVTSPASALSIEAVAEEGPMALQPVHVTVTSTPDAPHADAGEPSATPAQGATLQLVLGPSSATIWKTLADLAGAPTGAVRGRVTGTGGRPLVIGRDAQGLPRVRLRADEGGAFTVDAPVTVVEWYAAMDAGRASGLTTFVPGTRRDLLLDVSPGGDLHVSITDADTHAPLTARLFLHGIDGTVDPSFGPDYRASGAGPIIDALRGDVTTPLPSGRYRVAATKGIEWSVDAAIVDIAPGHVAEAALAPRHVVPTPGVLGCDLHVHARPSFDTPVTPEDRVLSLVAAGIDFAVPTEHNSIGDYASALDTLDLHADLLSVTGVEVTTFGRGFGHFGVFPYPPGTRVPPYRHTNINAIFRAVRNGDPNRYFQLNHPRLPNVGYFNIVGFDPAKPRTAISHRVDFDGIELYNGYDDERPERVDQVLRDYWALLAFGWRYVATGSSDSHRIQFHWAGYPRTMVMVDPHAETDAGDKNVDPLTVVANVKRGHAVVTSGPMIELQLGDARPGDEVVTTEPVLHGHLTVRAAPWIDVTHVEIMVGQVGGTCALAKAYDVPSVPTKLGSEPGTLAEAQQRTIRFDQDIDVEVGPDNGWIQVIARGQRPMDDVLPFMPVPPLALTNPVYVVRRRETPPPFPGAPARR
jgi:hypothetical protein